MAAETGEKTNKGFGTRTKLYQQRALAALPLLVRQAKAQQTILYSDLAGELGMPNPRNLNYPLGAIGTEMKALSAKKFGRVPPIQCVVVNKQTGFPGEGIGWFTGDAAKFRRSTRSEQRKVMREMLSSIYTYPRWDSVLEHYGLEPSKTLRPETLAREALEAVRRYGKGEGREHRSVKEFLATHPELFGLPPDVMGELEHPFPSADRLDVLFRHNGRLIGVEAKGPVSDDVDLGRGLFQCVKYVALLEAEQKLLQEGSVENTGPNFLRMQERTACVQAFE